MRQIPRLETEGSTIKEKEVHSHLEGRSLRQQTSGMECPICFDEYILGNDARGPRESAPTICEHMACNACWARLAQGPAPYRCAMCRADSTRWVLRNFETPAPPHYPFTLVWADEEMGAPTLRREFADRLHQRFPPPVPPRYPTTRPYEYEDEEAEYQAFRRYLADRLHLRFPDMDVDWFARIPHDIGLLEVLSDDLSLALGIRAP